MYRGTDPSYGNRSVISERRVYERFSREIPLHITLVRKSSGEVYKVVYNAEDAVGGDEFGVFFGEGMSITEVNPRVVRNVPAFAVNISPGGLLIESQYNMPEGSVIDIKLKPENDQERPLKALARVIRSEKDLPRGFLLAICFLDLSGADRMRIKNLLT